MSDKAKTKQVNLRIPLDLLDDIKAIAAANYEPPSVTMKRYLKQGVEAAKKGGKVAE